MKGTPLAMLLEMASPVPRLATCWKITQRISGAVITVTDHDVPLLDPTDGLLYVPVAGGAQSDIVADTSMQAANDNMTAATEDPYPTMESVSAGDWDYSRREVFMLCWADPSKGRHVLGSGTIGQISVALSESQIEGRGLLNALSQSLGDLTQPGCRHRLGDGSLGMGGCNNDGTIDLEARSVTGPVVSVQFDTHGMEVSIDEVQVGSPDQSGGIYAWGRLLVLEGANAGRSVDIKMSGAGGLYLHLPLPYPLLPGTMVKVYEGCDGSYASCRDRFSNTNNFDGERWLPGTDKMVQVARS